MRTHPLLPKPGRSRAPTDAQCEAALNAALRSLAVSAQPARLPGVGCCYDCGEPIDESRLAGDHLVCPNCNELVRPDELIDGRRAQLRHFLYPLHSNTQGTAAGFRKPHPPLWAYAANVLYQGELPQGTEREHAFVLAETRPSARLTRGQRYWSCTSGWSLLPAASVFTATERDRLSASVPIAGEWCRLPPLS